MSSFLDAVKKGDRASVEGMLATDPSLISARDENGVSAILLAHYYGKAEVADALLARHPELDIFEAATVGDVQRVSKLVAEDASLARATSSDGHSPLGLAAFFKRREVVGYLLGAGADPHAASRDQGFTPLHSAIANDAGGLDKEIIRLLLEAGADANARSRAGGTPLHTAAFVGDPVVVQLLLAHGADPTIRNDTGDSPLDVARSRHHSEAAALLHHGVRRSGTI